MLFDWTMLPSSRSLNEAIADVLDSYDDAHRRTSGKSKLLEEALKLSVKAMDYHLMLYK
jgi:hypothetical protein